MQIEADIVTWGVVGTIGSACGTLFVAINWLNKTFQTREAAKEQMKTINEKFDNLGKRFEATDERIERKFRENDVKMEGIHNHIRHLNVELKDQLKTVLTNVETNQRCAIETSAAVAYMKGKMENAEAARR